jgi:antitoxin VapB
MSTARYFGLETVKLSGCRGSFRLQSGEVEIFRRGDEIVLREKNGVMVRAFDLLAYLPDDLYLNGRENVLPQKRKGL